MKNWEEVYEKYKSESGEMEQRYNELKEKVENGKVETKIGDDGKEYVEKREVTKAEYKEFQSMRKFEKIKDNIPKVDNIIELKEKYKIAYKEMEVERSRRKTLKAQRDMMENLIKDMQEKIETRDKLTPFLYATDISDSKREKVKTSLVELNNLIEKLQEKHKVSVESFMLEDNLKTKYSELSDKDLKKSMRKAAVKVSKCDIVAGELMEGQSWDTIDYKLDNWTKYNDNKKIATELKDIDMENIFEEEQQKPVQEQSQPAPEPQQKPVQEQSQPVPQPQQESVQEQSESDLDQEPEQEVEEVTRTPQQKEEELAEQDFIHDIIKKKENKPVKVSDFLTRHPRIAKFVNWLRNNPIARRNAEKEAIKAKKEELKNIVENEKALSKQERPKVVEAEKARLEEEKENNDFKAYIRAIAEKGMDGVKKEQQEARKERLQPMKQAAYERETEKFGEEYARKSYEPKTQKENDSEER